MTDLERLWDDYDAGRAPVTAILAAAAGERRRRRRLLLRPLLTAGVVTGLAGAFVTGSQCLKWGLTANGYGRSSRNCIAGWPAPSTR